MNNLNNGGEMGGVSISQGLRIWLKALKSPHSLQDSAEWMYRLNVFARSTGRYPIVDQIYDLKNEWIRYLYQHGYCTEVKLHSQKRVCRACDGTGEYWSGEDCWKCNGSGVFTVTHLFAFRFEIRGTHYAWHQLEKLIDYPVELTPDIQSEPMPDLRKDPAILSLSDAWLGCCVVWWCLLWHGRVVVLPLFDAMKNRMQVVFQGKLKHIRDFIKLSKQYMNYPQSRIAFWMKFPRALARFLWFSRHDSFWKEGK